MSMNLYRLAMCAHEIGHMSMIYWRNESLHGYKAVINDDGSGAFVHNCGSYNVTELMVKIAGPLVEWLMHGATPERAIRFGNEYKDPQSDSSTIRAMVRQFRSEERRVGK